MSRLDDSVTLELLGSKCSNSSFTNSTSTSDSVNSALAS